MDVKFGLSHYEKNTALGRLRIGCLREYLDLRGLKRQEGEEKLHSDELHNS
jgi:hypothetical protein